MKAIQGQRVLVTRAEDDSLRWASRLEELGAKAIVFPCIECVLKDDPETANQLSEALLHAQWLVLCSRRGVQAVSGLLHKADARLPKALRIAAVGPATARTARELLGRTDLESTGGTSTALCSELAPHLEHGDHVVAALTALSDQSLEKSLNALGAKVTRIDVYQSGPVPAAESRTPLNREQVDLALLASPSAVTGLLNRARVPASFPVLTIGPSTTAAAKNAGLKVLAEARERHLEAMLDALEKNL